MRAWAAGILLASLTLGVFPVAAQAAVMPPETGSPTLHVGSLTLVPCPQILGGAWCTHVARPWDPSGKVPGSVSVGVAFVPARAGAAIGTVVPLQGGPGYSTSSDAYSYAEMYGGLLRDRNLLIVDQRGTGMSDPISCPSLSTNSWDWVDGVSRCGRLLGDRSGWYGTAMAADDLAAIVTAMGLGPIDLYGDSYGTWFAQVMSGRHAELLRTVVLDASYPVLRESPWYPSQGPALTRSLRAVCQRSALCAAKVTDPVANLERLLAQVRVHPIKVTAPGGDGRMHRVRITPSALVGVAFNGTYVPPTYRELAAAVTAALAGDALPLGRLLAEYQYSGEGRTPTRDYSDGLWAAVSCHDYPQLFDMTATAARRHTQYRAAITRAERDNPDMYAPFTIREYLGSDFAEEGVCQGWPRPAADNPPGPPAPPGGSYPSVPTLILAGEFDTITTPAEGDMVERQLPNASTLLIANALHVTAMDDPSGCSARLVRRVVRTGDNAIPADFRTCARDEPIIRAVGSYAQSVRRQQRPPGAPASRLGRVVSAATATAADLTDRWWQDFANHGHGLRGGEWTYRGFRTVHFTLDEVQLLPSLPVSGTATWDRRAETFTCDLTVDGKSGIVRIRARWSTTAPDAKVYVHVTTGSGVRILHYLAP